MNRTGLTIALAIAAVVGIAFAVFPELDIVLSRTFYRGSYGLWEGLIHPWARQLRHLAGWVIGLIVAPAAIALLLKLLLPRRPLLVPGRAIILMISTLALAPGILANTILKDNWHRPRPSFIKEFGGPAQFVPWWDPRGSCDTNCSFVAGEPAGAFWSLAPAALAPPAWRVAAYGAAIAFGTGVGLLRIAGGGHFFTDVVFAGFLTFMVIWLMHGLLYRWRATRFSDTSVERLLERITGPIYDAALSIAARIRGTAPRN